jgi:N-formylglutamate deformylase
MTPYQIIEASAPAVPIIVSVPHCGTAFPEEICGEYKPGLIAAPDDTDWFVQDLYNFVSAMGITMIQATFSRWVIDLNRDPQSKPLYTDGRIITGLCPTTNFVGEPLYIDEREAVEPMEIKRRLEKYYVPYHDKVKDLIEDRKSVFGKALLWDCHSIRQYVRTIQQEKFPDLILGDVDGTSASPLLIDKTLDVLRDSSYTVNHNHPFKGGQITRSFGKPQEHVHALQLEMTKVNYMDDDEKKFDQARAANMRNVLARVFEGLIQSLRR